MSNSLNKNPGADGPAASDMGAALPEFPIHDHDTALCLPPEDNRPGDRPGIHQLINSIRDHGQLVPGLVCPHSDWPDKYLILDGVGRWFACDRLGLPFRAGRLAAAVPEVGRIRLRLQHNVIRRNMTPDEIADDAARYMALRQCTQEEAARELHLSSATLSRALTAKRRIPAELKPLAEAVRPSIASLIAALPDAEAMRQAFGHATTPGKNGRLPTRDQMALYVEQFKKPKDGNSKPKVLRGTVEGRRVELGLIPGESTDAVIKFLQSLAGKLGKYRDLPPESLGSLFQG
jgi:ParB family chromosome partitioning protein